VRATFLRRFKAQQLRSKRRGKNVLSKDAEEEEKYHGKCSRGAFIFFNTTCSGSNLAHGGKMLEAIWK
jgi:hypothetical protein